MSLIVQENPVLHVRATRQTVGYAEKCRSKSQAPIMI